MNDHPRVPAPGEPTARGSLPDALTFFLTRDQRRAVLARLGVDASGRTDALLARLGLGDEPRPHVEDSTPRGLRRPHG